MSEEPPPYDPWAVPVVATVERPPVREVWVPGEPAVKERPRCTGRGARTTERTKRAEEAVGWAWKAAHRDEPIRGWTVRVEFRFYTRSSAKDVDNMVKLGLDALNGIAYADDRQVEGLQAVVFRGKALEPGTHVRVEPLTWEG